MADETTKRLNEDMAAIGCSGFGAERVTFTVEVPPSAHIGEVYGDDGFLYWAKRWEDVDQVESGWFPLEVYAKSEYVRELLLGLYRCGGRVQKGGE